ncbi:MAG: sodium/solute symporter [Proteobacteria bacterium]|nr:sodium/solute symporter [Pseudomonadota bacterium]
MVHLHALDVAAISVYVLLTIGIGIWTARGHTTAADLFLAGRSLGPVAVGFSLFASNISSDTLIGLPGAAYASGISAANYEWMASAVLMVSVFWVYPVLIRSRVTTLPELMQRRFDARMRRYLSATTLFLSIVLDTAGTLYAGALVVTTFTPGLSLTVATLAMALFTAAYTAAGGLRAVVYTDVMQALVLVGGSTMLAWIVFGHYDYSWSKVQAQVPASHLTLIRPMNDPGVPWLGLITGLPVVGFYYWTMNQYIIQRVLGARDLPAAGRGALLAGGLKLLPLFIMTLPGAMAIPLLPHLAHPDQVWPELVFRFAPAGLTGVMIAALLAALMSTCSATLNSAATLLTLDFLVPTRQHWTQDQITRAGRIFTVIIAVVAAMWAPQIAHFQGLWAYLQQVFAFVASPLVAIFVLGLALPSLGPTAALRGLLSGHVLSAALFIAQQAGWMRIHFTVVGGVLFAVTVVLTCGWMSALGPNDQTDPTGSRATLLSRVNLPRLPADVYVLAAIVLAGIGSVLWMFW